MNYLFAGSDDRLRRRAAGESSVGAAAGPTPYPGSDAAGFARRIEQLLGLYDWEVTKVQLNLLDSHDTPRVLSLARGDQASLRLATLFQMTYPGAPCVYYGDEIALRGTVAYDRGHRDHERGGRFPGTTAAVGPGPAGVFPPGHRLAARPSRAAAGAVPDAVREGHCYAFARCDANRALIVVLNAGDERVEIELPVGDLPPASLPASRSSARRSATPSATTD